MDGEQEDKRNAFERFGESFLDAAAQKNPFLAGLRGAVQTQGWKEEQAYKNLQKKYKLLDVQKKQNELDEWNKNAPVREQNRELIFRKNRRGIFTNAYFFSFISFQNTNVNKIVRNKQSVLLCFIKSLKRRDFLNLVLDFSFRR